MGLEAALEVTVDEAVVFEFVVRNTGPDPVELTFRSGQIADVTVSDSRTGDVVWRWGSDKMFTQAIQQQVIEPHASLREELVWPDPSSGEYLAVGRLEADVKVEAQSRFTVP